MSSPPGRLPDSRGHALAHEVRDIKARQRQQDNQRQYQPPVHFRGSITWTNQGPTLSEPSGLHEFREREQLQQVVARSNATFGSDIEIEVEIDGVTIDTVVISSGDTRGRLMMGNHQVEGGAEMIFVMLTEGAPTTTVTAWW